MENALNDAAVGAILGLKYSLVIIHSTETQSLGVVRTQDLITAKGEYITIAGLWPGTGLEVGAGWAVEEIMTISSYSILESLEDRYVDFDAVMEALPKAIQRLEEHLATE